MTVLMTVLIFCVDDSVDSDMWMCWVDRTIENSKRHTTRRSELLVWVCLDMIGYHSPAFPLPRLDLVTLNTDATMTALVRDVVGQYVPANQLTVSSTTACCSGKLSHETVCKNLPLNGVFQWQQERLGVENVVD